MTRFEDTIEKLRRTQKLIRVLLDEATEMLSPPADDRDDRWLPAVAENIFANVREQFRIEATSDYMADVLEQFPAWHPQVLHLQQEHRLLEAQIADITRRIERESKAGHVSQESRRQFKDWIKWYRDHERRETDLTQEAFVLEVGQGE